MELFYSELKKREVINVTDGRSLGFIMALKLKFPEGKLLGIVVPGRKTCALLRIFDKSRVYIEECKIIKIGGDVILVDLRRQASCLPPKPKPAPSNPCTPQNPCPPPPRPESRSFSSDTGIDLTGIFDGDEY